MYVSAFAVSWVAWPLAHIVKCREAGPQMSAAGLPFFPSPEVIIMHIVFAREDDILIEYKINNVPWSCVVVWYWSADLVLKGANWLLLILWVVDN